MSVGSRRGLRLLALASLLLGCRDQLRFDEHSTDGGPDATAARGDGGCVATGTGWHRRDDRNAGACGLECGHGTTCVGTCGDGCSAECESNCTLSTGASGSVACEGATADLTVGDGSQVFCAATSSCTVRCPAGCTIHCSTSSTCQLQCASDGAPRPVTGSASCP